MNGGKIVADMIQFEEAPLFPHADGSKPDPGKAQGRLCRWKFDLDKATDTFAQEFLDDQAAEFPRIDERRAGLEYRHGFYATAERRDVGDRGVFNGISHIDHETGRRRDWCLPGGDTISEPVFVARSDSAGEGDGFLLATAFRWDEKRSDLLVFDAGDVSQGPVAVANLDTRVPQGFHGIWRAA